MTPRAARAANAFAAAAFLGGYALLLADPRGRAETWPWLVSTGACLVVVARDERRLAPARLALALPVSRTLHVLAFGPIAVVVHFLRTRWPDGAPRALAVAALAGAAATAPEMLLAALSDPASALADLPVTAVVLGLLPLPLALVWRALAAADARFDVQRAAVVMGVVLVVGSACGVALAIGAPALAAAGLGGLLVLAVLRALGG